MEAVFGSGRSGALWMGGAGHDWSRSQMQPLVLHRAEGIYLYDQSGKRYIDAIASLETCAIGHGRTEMAAAVSQQLGRLDFYDTLRHVSDVTVELAEVIQAIFPPPLNHVHFATSGSEAIEAAIKTARQFHVLNGDTKKVKVLSRQGAYHGCTFGAMALDGNYYRTRTNLFAPLPGQGRFVESRDSASAFEELIRLEGADSVSAIVVDPMATASGIYPPPPNYWTALREICDRHRILLIADEAITGFGRTGQWFASVNEQGKPDLVTISKGLTSGYMPMSAVISSDRVAAPFDGVGERVFFHGHTFSGHPAAAAAALANIRIIESERLVDNAREVGEYLGALLNQVVGDCPLAGEVRGKGLLYGIQLLPTATRNAQAVAVDVISRMRDDGALTFLLHPGDVLFLCPPLTITRNQCDDLAEIVRTALMAISKAI